jgi:putative lipase involved disintegration of autophagic bodies
MYLASPEANIWIIGHSLGGALASLMGITFGTPVVAFESPGERMALLDSTYHPRYVAKKKTIQTNCLTVSRAFV